LISANTFCIWPALLVPFCLMSRDRLMSCDVVITCRGVAVGAHLRPAVDFHPRLTVEIGGDEVGRPCRTAPPM
jgi:hypothetical protein